MKTAARWLLVGWLLAALVLLGIDGRLPEFLAWTVPGSLLGLGVGALVRQQLAPFCFNRPLFPERYRMADDLRHSPSTSSSWWPKRKPRPTAVGADGPALRCRAWRPRPA